MPLANSNVLQEVFGYPPDNLEERTNIMIRKSMPVVEFRPSTPHFQNGLDLFTIIPAWGSYTKLLNDNGFISPNTGTIKLAFLADNFPTDTFTNEYGENFLQKFTDVASEGASSIAQMFGAESATQVFNKVGVGLKESDNAAASAVGTGMEWLKDAASSAHEAISKVGSVGKFAANSVSLIDRLAAGSRIDFPMVWKSSGFQPSYSFTIRLYNPWPQDPDYTNKYIIGPIVAIMLMGVPRSQDSSTFTWPFLHQITCPGLFDLNPGFISNITVVKGGDQQQIAFQQRMGLVDVRIDVGSLYSSMLAGSNNVTSTRPTVKKYAEILAGGKDVSSRIADNNRYINKAGDGPEGGRSVGFVSKLDEQDYLNKYGTLPNLNNPIPGIQRQTTSPKIHPDDTGSPGIVERVSATAKQTYAELLAQLGL